MIRLLLRVLGQKYARPLRRTVALMVAAAVIEGVSYALLVPTFRAVFSPAPETAWPWIIAFAVAIAAYGVVRYISDLMGFRVGAALLRGTYHRLGDHLAALPTGWFSASRIGDVSVLAGRGVLQAMSAIAHLLGPLISATVTPATIAIVIFCIDWRVGLATFAVAPAIIALRFRTEKSTTSADTDRMTREQEATGRVVEFLHAQPVLRAGSRNAERFELLDRSLRELEISARRATIATLPGALGLTAVVQAAFTALLALAAYLAVGGQLRAPDALAILLLATLSTNPLLSLNEIRGKIRGARTVLVGIDDVLRTEPLPVAVQPETPAQHSLELEAVTLRAGDRTVIDDVSLIARSGQRLALIGPSGAGKSTILKLLARFSDVDSGAVRVGGVDVRNIDPATLMAQFSIVFQDVYLFAGTIEQNIRLGRPGATDAEVRAAAAAAQLDDVISRLPEGWATEVGEGGARLSGGERQRVSIARALLKNAPIVLLDEVTSALDPVNDAAVHAGIDRLCEGRTVVMVAHRMRSVRGADRIVFIDNGRVLEQGTHAELLHLNGRYAEYWKLSDPSGVA
ncbi:ABC transporter ATP-binding protein [Amycolatopsis rubida]|uniref:ATP-binding cassette, subfamily B n=1 Tax=Amycolatopsis rubida TaxID=112413 RepID=A0A1I5ZF88_9PSEU|nr:ABC transporter ATP-binding protein [Amycolatopsis rubida]SFQ55126.1 ATP-binding cassette, subfamily B [Amycolatopsis rubida]